MTETPDARYFVFRLYGHTLVLTPTLEGGWAYATPTLAVALAQEVDGSWAGSVTTPDLNMEAMSDDPERLLAALEMVLSSAYDDAEPLFV